MPSCSSPSRSTRSETPESTSSRTLSCSRIPARWVCSISRAGAELHDDGVDAGPGQQVAEHQAGRPAADDARRWWRSGCVS